METGRGQWTEYEGKDIPSYPSEIDLFPPPLAWKFVCFENVLPILLNFLCNLSSFSIFFTFPPYSLSPFLPPPPNDIGLYLPTGGGRILNRYPVFVLLDNREKILSKLYKIIHITHGLILRGGNGMSFQKGERESMAPDFLITTRPHGRIIS
jgi:hypothetical protein